MKLTLATPPLLSPFGQMPGQRRRVRCRVLLSGPGRASSGVLLFLMLMLWLLWSSVGIKAQSASPMDAVGACPDSLWLGLPLSAEDRVGLKRSVAKDERVVATRGGEVYIYNKEKGKFEHWFSIAESLGSADTVKSISLDSMGKIWINTSKGVFIHVASKLCGAADKAESDSVALPSDVSLYFTNIRVSGAPIIKGGKEEGKPLIGPIDGVSDITLTTPPNSFSLSVFTLGEPLSEPRYSWKLEGFDKNWSDRTSNCYINYTNLPSGRYTLMVKMYEGGRVAERSLRLTVLRPFWQTWWFMGLVILGIVCVVAAIVMLHKRMRKLRFAAVEASAPKSAKGIKAASGEDEDSKDASEAEDSASEAEETASDGEDSATEAEESALEAMGDDERDALEVAESAEGTESSEDTDAVREEQVKGDQNDEFMKRAEECVKENITNETFGKGEFASAMMISQSLLYKKIKAATDMSVVEFIRMIRLRHAMALLKDGKYNVTEVSEMCGFSSSAYFSRVFKESFGISPSEVIPK